MIKMLNPVIRGWANYHKYNQSAKTFFYTDTIIFYSLWRWARRRHSNKSAGWIKKKYFNHPKLKSYFSYRSKDKTGKIKIVELLRPSMIKLVKYIKVKASADPFNPIYLNYFKMRRASSNTCPI